MKLILLTLLLLFPVTLYGQEPKLDMFGLDPVPAPKPLSTAKQPIGNHWNIEGDWNASDAKIAEHIRNTHGINPKGLTREQMLAAHDQAHERTKSKPVQQVYPTSSCPGGVCPIPTRRRRW